MDQKKWETMDNVKIYYRRLVVFCALFLLSIRGVYAQSSLEESVHLVLDCVVDVALEPLIESRLSENYILVFKTERSCIPCYKDMKHHFEQNYPNHQVFVVVIMEEQYLYIDREVSSIMNYYPDPTAFLFLFKNEEALVCSPEKTPSLIYDWILSPSPFYVIKTGDHLKLVDSNSTIEFIENKELYYNDVK